MNNSNNQNNPFTPEERRGFLGGSDAGTILGVNPFQTAYELWRVKVGIDEPFAGNQATAWGHYFEDLVARAASERLNVQFRRSNTRYKHPEHSWLVAHIDRMSRQDDLLLECKTTTSRSSRFWGADGLVITNSESAAGVIPLQHYWQVQQYLLLTRLNKAYLAVAILDDRDIRMYKIWSSIDDQARLVDEAKTFWSHVTEATPPPNLSTKDFDLMYPESESESAALCGEHDLRLIEEYQKIKAQEHDLVEQRKLVEAEIKRMIGECEELRCGDQKVATWKNQTRESLDLKSLKIAKPELFEKFNRVSSYRVLRVM